MQDRPTAPELLRAAREFCERDLLPELDGRRRFHTRVLINVLGILEREWGQEEDALSEEWERLRDLLRSATPTPPSLRSTAEGVRTLNTELSSKIRAGEMDDRWDETLEALCQTIATKLAIANPGYASGPSET